MPPARDSAGEARSARLLVDLQQRFSTIPGVRSAAAVSMRPLRGTGTGMGFAAADKPRPPSNEIPWASWRLVTRDYFRTMGVRLVAGRDFTEQDLIAKPWRVIISQRIAEQLWPGESAVGRPLVLWAGQSESRAEVVGVVSNMRDWSLTEDPTLAVYLPYYGTSSPAVNFVMHAATGESVIPAVRVVVAELSPGSPISNVTDLGAMVDRSVASRKFTMMLMASLAVVALILALAGVYGVLSYSVSQRRSEMGMRLALGASTRSVLRLVMRQGMMPVFVGLVIGVAGAAALSRFMTTLLFDITPGDFLTYASVAALLGGAAALACYLPARDALRVDVLAALREE
jgi:predicted permease